MHLCLSSNFLFQVDDISVVSNTLLVPFFLNAQWKIQWRVKPTNKNAIITTPVNWRKRIKKKREKKREKKKKKNYSRHVNFLSYNNILHQETSTSTTKKKRENRINVKLFKTRKLSEKIGRLRWNDKQVQVKHSN